MKTAMIAVLTMIACGGPSRPAPSEPVAAREVQPHDTRHPGGGEAHEMAMPPEVKAFHDTLAPRWHAEHGPKRTADTCAAIPEFRTRAEAIARAAPPAGAAPADWADKGKQLGEAVTALEAACKAGDAAAFEPAFARVHDAFHATMEAGEHGEHGEHDRH